tara:strand:+ start:17933 stop:18859 length:927 start_codon:yes stop_codon:yes gene_type:complete
MQRIQILVPGTFFCARGVMGRVSSSDTVREMAKKMGPKFLNNQRGQGVTEYILVLVIIVAMVFGGIYQLNTAFQKWANNYFGEYLACILETGELPSIGGAPGDSGICNQLFEPFDFANGRRLKEDGGGGSGSDNGLSDRSRRGSGKGGGGTRESAAGSRGSLVSRSFRNSNGSGSRTFASSSQQEKQKKKYTGESGTTSYGGSRSSSSGGMDGRPRYLDVPKSAIVDTSEKEGSTSSSKNAVKKDSKSERTPRTFKVIRKEIKKQDNNEADEPMTFGSFLRFLIIAAIIIALVLFLGGQALQISKNSE